MIDKIILKDVLEEYKNIFCEFEWEKEEYKWKAIKHFQDNWNIDAEDFTSMMDESLAETSNLLSSNMYFPRGMLDEFCGVDPEYVREMFRELYNEDHDAYKRIEKFKQQAIDILDNNKEIGKNHYQDEHAISIYLWLRYPDKYYIYKYSEVQKAADKLKCDLVFKKGRYEDNINNQITMYNEICKEIKKDQELISMIEEKLNDEYYDDPEFKTLTHDIVFYISRYYGEKSKDEWEPKDYSPNITKEEWKELLEDESIFNTSSLEIMKRIKDLGKQTTCTQLSNKYGNTVEFYRNNSIDLAMRVHEKTSCPVLSVENEQVWWPILYEGKNASKELNGSFVWKLRDELSDALDETDLSKINLYQKEENNNYWFLVANPKYWKMSSMPEGEVQEYTLYNANGNQRRIFKYFLEAKKGDKVIGYESAPTKQIVALFEVEKENDGEFIWFKKIEGLSNPIDYSTLRDAEELKDSQCFPNPQGSLFKLEQNEYEYMINLIREENPPIELEQLEKYDSKKFLEDVYMKETDYNRMVRVLKKKKNIILQGVPGVGKTFCAKRLAYSLMGEKNDDRIEFVQFHQNYSYEDFVMGYKPEEDKFVMKYGVFYKFCKKAANHPNDKYYFIIDEINRGNMSKIFGELLMLIEADYRGKDITLAYNDLPFSVPENLYIIGMMNTADRSLAMIDYALRRRFSFIEMKPGFDSKGFDKYKTELNNKSFNDLILQIKLLNDTIMSDPSLGKGFCIGHSYFCNIKSGECNNDILRDIVDYDIVPMLEEYWFDDQDSVDSWKNKLSGVLDEQE